MYASNAGFPFIFSLFLPQGTNSIFCLCHVRGTRIAANCNAGRSADFSYSSSTPALLYISTIVHSLETLAGYVFEVRIML